MFPGLLGQQTRRDWSSTVQWFSNTSLMNWVSKRIGVVTSTAEFSGASLADLAVDARYATGSGGYFQAQEGKLSKVRSSTVSYDEQRALTLWNDTKGLVGLLPAEEPAQLR
jgi:hypothetical protein